MNELYIPEGSLSLDKVTVESQLRLGIQGAYGCGKSFEALTFPNCVVANFDAGLRVHYGRKDVIDVPFWNDSFVDKIIPRDGFEAPPNRRDALLIWLNTEARKLSSKQTLVIDSNRQVEEAYHTQYRLNPVISRKGKDDGFAEWNHKITYFQRLGTLYKSLPCNVIYLCHEVDDVNDDGSLNGKVKVALSGQSGRTIGSDFTDWFRQLAIAKPRTQERKDALLASPFNPGNELDNWISSTPEQHDTIYLWMTQSDEICKCKTSMFNQPKFVVAHSSTFDKYKLNIKQKEQ